jgi:hypothetical protein
MAITVAMRSKTHPREVADKEQEELRNVRQCKQKESLVPQSCNARLHNMETGLHPSLNSDVVC